MTSLRTGRALVPAALLLFVLVIAVGAGLAAASPSPPAVPAASAVPAATVAPAAPVPIASGGGEHVIEAADEISPAERLRIQRAIDANIALLEQQGKLQPRTSEDVELAFPLRPAAGLADPGFYVISGFVDHNPAYPSARRDYQCGSRTYDTSEGYNHSGTDYYLWPFSWNLANAGAVEIVAAAPGTIVYREDGEPDRNCYPGYLPWNAVYVRHADGSVAWYGHMRNGSLTPKIVGMTVEAGEYLGQVGSSGSSTGPHLHFELRRAGGEMVDPYVGACNLTTRSSWWIAQEPYVNPAVLKLMTGTAAIQWGTCPNADITHQADYFRPGDAIHFNSFFRDYLVDTDTIHRIYRPDGSVWHEWTHRTALFYALARWWWVYRIEEGAPLGEWRYEVTFDGQTHTHRFHLTDDPGPMLTASPTPTPTATATPTATPTPPPTPTPDPRFIFPVFVPLVGG